MTITHKDTCSIITYSNGTIQDFANLVSTTQQELKDKNLIIDVLKINSLTLKSVLLFLETSNTHRANMHSFVIVNEAIHIDDVPEELMVVPTLQEAEDVIEMEDIERDLGL